MKYAAPGKVPHGKLVTIITCDCSKSTLTIQLIFLQIQVTWWTLGLHPGNSDSAKEMIYLFPDCAPFIQQAKFQNYSPFKAKSMAFGDGNTWLFHSPCTSTLVFPTCHSRTTVHVNFFSVKQNNEKKITEYFI